jgi:sulfur-oxidizing protein SoxB
MTNTSMTYGETYVNELKGAQLKDILEGIAENLFVQSYHDHAAFCIVL